MPATAVKWMGISSGLSAFDTTGSVVNKIHGVTNATFKILEKTEVVQALQFLGPSAISAETQQSGEGSIEFVVTYQEIPKILNGFFTAIGASTTTDFTGIGYTYPYTAPTNSTQVHYLYTLEYGTTAAAYRANGVVFTDLTLKGEAGGLHTGTVNFIAKEIVPTTSGLSTAASDRAVTPVRMADTTLYVDAFSTGTIGATSVSASLISYELALKTGRHVKQFAGALKPADYGEGRWAGTLKLTGEFNSSVKAYVDELLDTTGAAVRRQVRIGATQDSSSSTKTMRLDFAGIKNEGETLFGDRDGNLTVDLGFEGVYSTGLGNWLAASVTMGSSSTT